MKKTGGEEDDYMGREQGNKRKGKILGLIHLMGWALF